jgi:hypothetical protein
LSKKQQECISLSNLKSISNTINIKKRRDEIRINERNTNENNQRAPLKTMSQAHLNV